MREILSLDKKRFIIFFKFVLFFFVILYGIVNIYIIYFYFSEKKSD